MGLCLDVREVVDMAKLKYDMIADDSSLTSLGRARANKLAICAFLRPGGFPVSP